jgi:Sec-independent protein translocase protein TatA
MDGIFGVGLAEMLIVGLALFIIGGPKNTAKWARELGRYVRMARDMWHQVLADMENELGPEGKELMDAARELGQGARDVTRMNPTRQLMGETLRMVDAPKDTPPALPATAPAATDAAAAAPSGNGSGTPSDDARYQAWTPPDSTQKPE